MSFEQQLGSIKAEPCLLIANFELLGESLPIVVDTGASISCLPENGLIMKKFNPIRKSANLNVQLADNGVVHMDQKVVIPMKPTKSTCQSVQTAFYIAKGANDVIGYQALVGLEQLKLFDLNIKFYNGQVQIYHQGTSIGQNCEALKHIKCSVIVDDRFDTLKLDSDLTQLVKRYKRVFADIGRDPIYGRPMRIYTTHNRPIFSKQRHYAPEEIQQMKQHINGLLKKGIIEPTCSGYSATSRIIPKKSGTGRLVVNYIPLNAVTLRDSYALPHVSDILAVLEGKQYFTTMDCAQGFYQILVDYKDRPKTAFSTPIGSFQFVRCPFGARNSCATFQAEMNRIFADGLYTRCVIYVDDILVFGTTKQEHDDNLAWVLSKCAEFNVRLKLEKCHFRKQEVDYLGFRVSGKAIRPLEDRVQSLSNSEPPRDKTELRSVIGKLNFYSRFINNYSKQLEPLRELLKKNRDFQWKPCHQAIFEKLLKSLSEAPEQLLANRMTEKFVELHVMRDSLEVICLDQDERLICRTSRFLSPAEANYSTIEKQLLALVLAINRFRTWLHPEHFIIRIPTKDLGKTLQLVNKPERVESILLRMPEGFDIFQFEVKDSLMTKIYKKLAAHVPEEVYYVDGACKKNGKPDCQASWAVCAEFDRSLELSGFVEHSPSNNSAELTAAIKACEEAKERGQRSITIITDSKYLHSAATNWIDKWQTNQWLDHRKKLVVNTELFKQLLIAKEGLEIDWIHVKGHADTEGNIRVDMLARSLLSEESATICALSQGTRSIQDDSEEIEAIKKQIDGGLRPDLTIDDDGIVYYMDRRIETGDPRRIYVPQASRLYLLSLAHDDSLYGGHLGIRKTHSKLMKFWWPRLPKDVEEYVKRCDTCQRFKEPAGPTPGYLNCIPVSKIFEHVHIDIVGPVTRTTRGNSYIITATDAFSKWAFAGAVQNIRTTEVIKFLEDKITSLHGRPATIISDRGSQFVSAEWKDYLNKTGIEANLTSPYHPQSNGIDERLNGTLVRILRAYVDEYQEDWDLHLKWALFVYNTTVHNSTGYAPYHILHGLDSRSPLKGNTLEIENHEEIDRIREAIRECAKEANEKAQKVQKDYYDRTHRASDIKVGQKVLKRNHTAPTDLSKKFYPKWDGPHIVLTISGDPGAPKAVEIFDCSTQRRKFIALKDVKPYLDPPTKEDITTQGETGEFVELQSDAHLTPGDFISFDCPATEPKNNDLLDFDELTCGPISSSPRRVTLSDNIETYYYEPGSYVDNSEGDFANNLYPAGSNQDNEHEPTQQAGGRDNLSSGIDAVTPDESPTLSDEAPRSKYQMEFIIDDPILDPTFDPSDIDVSQIESVNTTIRECANENLPSEFTVTNDTLSADPDPPAPRYNLRPRSNYTNYSQTQARPRISTPRPQPQPQLESNLSSKDQDHNQNNEPGVDTTLNDEDTTLIDLS